MKNCFRLKNFPISFFAPVLGFAGFSLALQRIESLFSMTGTLSLVLLIITIILFIIVLTAYLLKFLVFKKEVIKEYQHPIKINFFPLISKILLVLSVAFLGLNMATSKWLWIIGVFINMIFTLSILGEWISREHFIIEHMSPAWFIPVVGNLIIPIAGVKHFSLEISWFFFSVGVVWMFILTTVILYRLIFHEPLVKKLIPTLFILFAAPAIAFISYYKLVNNFDAFAHVLYYFSVFLLFLLCSRWKLFLKIKFYLSWWAYTFPLAAFSLSTVLMYHITKLFIFKYFALVVFCFLILFIFILSWKTIVAMKKKEICVDEV